MPSSTSSSERWGRLSALTALLAVAGLGLLEGGERWAGYTPSVTDDESLWAAERARASDPDVLLVLLGASRIQLAFDPTEVSRRYPGRTCVQLAVDGTQPIATLRDLGDDPTFHGLVVCSLCAVSLVPQRIPGQEAWVRAYHSGSPDRRVNARLRAGLQARLTVLLPHLSSRELLQRAARGRRPDPPSYLRTLEDRSRLASYDLLPDLPKHRARRIALHLALLTPALDAGAWAAAARSLRTSVEAIQSRGGRVVLFRPPTSGESLAADEAAYPRARFWDRLRELTGAETLHFADVPVLTALDLPDTSHVDAKARDRFTLALLGALVESGAIPTAR